MPKFFSNNIIGNRHVINGDDAFHISKSLRMSVNDELTLCDTLGYDYDCTISKIDNGSVYVDVNKKYKSLSEPSINVTLYQGVPKGSKLDLICQKSVELGVKRIVPVAMDRCVSIIKSSNKINRLQKIAYEAAKQSRRSIIPTVSDVLSLSDAVYECKNSDKVIFFYEKGGQPTNKLVDITCDKNISIFIGPEGGFSEDEVNILEQNSFKMASLGNRILRTETAPIVALSILMYMTSNL